MRLPNSYGSVTKLSGARRNPWVVRKTIGYDDDGKIIRKVIGYYPTRAKAMQALADYNDAPFTLDKITFAQLYDKFKAYKYPKIGDSGISGYNAAYNRCSHIFDMPFTSINIKMCQEIIDAADTYATRKKIKTMFSQMYDFAVTKSYIPQERDFTSYLKLGKATKSELHFRFNNDEVQTLWDNADDAWVQLILIMIYTGARPGELFKLKCRDVDFERKCLMIREGKNENATRLVPIHKRIEPFIRALYGKGYEYLITRPDGSKFNFITNHSSYTDKYFTPILDRLGILIYKNSFNEEKEHLPDDTRHTFTSMWHDKKLDDIMRRKIQGHSGKGVGEIVYSHNDLKVLYDELNLL